VDLTSDDVQDILALLDGLPFGELHLQTARFRLSLRRTADGEWTQELAALSAPRMLTTEAAPAPGGAVAAGEAAAARAAAAGEAAQAGEAAAAGRPMPDQAAEAAGQPAPAGAAAGRPTPAGDVPGGGGLADQAADGGPADGLRAVHAPLLGTFYRAPRPGAPPFVEVGSHVEADTVVGIIETMKLMNSVCAGVRGFIAEILIADAQFAAQDSALMRVREER
jgi:acetyl-CoA carboxylase biotin carboxyl carrier protein